MMAALWVVLVLASTGFQLVQGFPVDLSPTPRVPHETSGSTFVWSTESGLYAVFPALALVLTAVGFLFGCTWCYRHKDCKLFAASVTHLQDARRSQPPDSGFSEPVNNNISEDNNNGPISLREMQNIANNNAAAYIISENEERNRISRESVVEFEPLPTDIRVVDPLERCADWFAGEDFPRNQLQYLREIGRGWFGRVVEGELDDEPSSTTVAVKILNQNASLEDKARFLEEARLYRDMSHENILGFVAKCLQEDPWILIFELCSMDLQQYLITNRPKMAILNESGVPLQLMCDVTSALAYMHSRGFLYGYLWSGNVLIRGSDNPRAVVGHYARAEPQHHYHAPESRNPAIFTASNDVWSLGNLIWEICAWGASPPDNPPPPDLPCPYRNHLYQVMQLCWNESPEERPTAAQVHALINHLHFTHTNSTNSKSDGYATTDFEDRWQRLKPNTIPKLDEHVAIIHVPSTSMTSHFTGSDQDFDNGHTIQDSLSVEMDTAVSRSSSIMSDKDPLSIQIKSESLTNLHGSLEDVRNIYLTHNETAALECHQGNINLEESKEKDQDRSDSSVDPWLKDIITDSQDDVSYFKDVSDVIKNLDNILNSEKTSSSESSHQASPSRDNLSLECKKDYPMQTSMVKSPGISNFQNILDMGFNAKSEVETCDDDDGDRDTIGTLSHSFERHSDTISQQTLENITPDTPIKELDVSKSEHIVEQTCSVVDEPEIRNMPNFNKIDNSDSDVPNLKELSVATPSVSNNKQKVILNQDCQTSYDNRFKDIITGTETKSVDVNAAFISNEIGYLENEYFTAIEKDKCQSENRNNLSIENSKILVEDARTMDDSSNNSLVNKNFNNEINLNDRFNNFFNEDTSISLSPPDQDNNKTTVLSGCVSLYNDRRDDETSSEFKSSLQEKRNENEIINYSLQSSKSSVLNVVSPNEPLIPNCQSPEKEKYIINDTVNITASMPDLEQSKELVSHTNETLVKRIFEEKEDSLISPNKESKNFTGNFNAPQINSLEKSKYSNTFIKEEDNSYSNTIQGLNVFQEPEINITEAKQLIENKDEIIQHVSLDVNGKCAEKTENIELADSAHNLEVVTIEQPEEVQHKIDVSSTPVTCLLDFSCEDIQTHDSTKPEEVQNSDDNAASHSQAGSSIVDDVTFRLDEVTESRSDIIDVESVKKQNNTTVSMDLINDTNSKILDNSSLDDNLKYVIQSCLGTSGMQTPFTILKNESTEYLDLPSIIKETNDFLHFEKVINSQYIENVDNICTSTPKGSDPSAESTLEGRFCNLSETKVPDYGQGVTLTKLEQKYVPESPFESPSKSHHTDTYDENSSIVLGPFENCTLELFKGVKSTPEITDLPREELLAFSSNFSEMNLETPSPLRDGNFLNEVPDIVPDELHLDDIATISEAKPESLTENTVETEQSSTEKRLSPLTPPNSPGNFLASTSQQTYIVDVDISNIDNIVDSSQIDLQLTTKLAMADNENNLNIEYSGPLTEEGLTLDDSMLRDNDAIPESYLAGNGGSLEDLTIDEDRMKELRNELELKLPLAQVAGIEPPVVTSEGEWSELPPPPQVILTYGALSPIAEETRTQLNAYENDDQWNASIRTESSASYPEPCNNSTESATELPTGANTNTALPLDQSTYTIHSKDSVNHTYTVQKDGVSSKEVTMSADSLNASPLKKIDEIQSPVDDKTYIINDEEKESNCDRLSQVSPFLLSPTTDTSAPEISENAVGLSTISKTTIPTDAKSSKPSETQCLSKATSIDSWCSNDTLYNVEENFDDLAMDPDIPMNFEEKDKSESEDTLTHNDDEKEASHCSTYIIHDSKSEVCETFSPDSITANDNYTYTKLKTDAVTQSAVTKSDFNDSTKSQTKDLAYGTLMSGLPSYSNCTTEMVSGMEDPWKFLQPELVRKSPVGDESELIIPNHTENKGVVEIEGPKTNIPILKKMDSIEISCFKDNSTDIDRCETSDNPLLVGVNDSPDNQFRHIEHSVTSTPLAEVITFENNENIESKPFHEVETENSPQQTQQMLSYADFEDSAFTKAQDSGVLSQSMGSGASSEDFSKFKNNAKELPQDLSIIIANQSESHRVNKEPESLVFLPKFTSLLESQNVNNAPLDIFITDLDVEEETEQPHSIIITESPLVAAKVSTSKSFDLHAQNNSMNINSPISQQRSIWQPDSTHFDNVNGEERSEVDYTVKKDETENSLESQSISEQKSKDDIEDLVSVDERNINDSVEEKNDTDRKVPDTKCNGSNEMFATVNFLNETFEELMESNVDDHDLGVSDTKDENFSSDKSMDLKVESLVKPEEFSCKNESPDKSVANTVLEEKQISSVTEDFLKNEKKFCQLDSFFPLLSDIRFTGPATEIMTTSFTQDSPTEPTSPECEHDSKPDPSAETLKEWDSDSDSHSTNSSSGEFIWKQRDSGSQPSGTDEGAPEGEAPSSGTGDSGSGSEEEDVEFVPSSWDCRAAPSKSSLRSMEQTQDSKKKVVFKRQKYHCVYEYPREAPDLDVDSPAYLPDFSTYAEWDPSSAEDAELGYGQFFGANNPLDMLPLRAGIAFGADYDEDFFISSSARPFESLGVMSTTSQFFPGMHIKPSLERDFPDDLSEDFPPPPSPLPPTTLVQTRTPSLDFTTPDSGVEDITPGSITDDEFKAKKLPDDTQSWRSIDSASSSESVSPSSPGGEALGGLRHTRDKLKLDLPPSPHIPSPRHNRVFNFVLEKPKRQRDEKETTAVGTTPLVMTDETPIITMSLPTNKDSEDIMPEPTFSTFGKSAQKPSQSTDTEKNIILTDEEEPVPEVKEEPNKVEPVKGEGTVLDSGDEDSGIESSSKATLERKPTPNIS